MAERPTRFADALGTGPRIGLALAVLLLALPSAGIFYTDWLWFSQVGYGSVLLTSVTTRFGLGVVVTLAAFTLLALSFRSALRGLRVPLVTLQGPGQETTALVIGEQPLKLAVLGLAALLSVAMGLAASGRWLTWLLYLKGGSFGVEDPILSRDVGFYVFELPLLEALHQLLMGVLVLTLVGSGALHGLGGGLRLVPESGLVVSRTARRQLSLLGAALMACLGFGAWLDRAGLLLSPVGVIHGASAADVEARLPALGLLIVAAAAGALLLTWNAFSRGRWMAVGAVGGYLLVALAGNGYAAALQRFVIAPNELVRETPYIVYNIAATRKAFGLDRVEERDLSGDEALTREDIERNAATIRNVRLWDHQPLLDTFGQIQEIRTYYDFVSVDNDRYVIDGAYRQIMLSARELNSTSLPNRTWINERLSFTHGYGLTLGPVNEVTEEGLPLLFIKDLPPQSSVDLKVEQPSLYYGELSNDYVFVGSAAREFHYPQGEDNVFAAYEGSGGVPLDSLLKKALFALRFGSLKILLSQDIGRETRVMFHRRVQERVAEIAPFLLYDSDPYLVISEGRLFWIQDAYTASSRYPYSTPSRGQVNYIRNSVKVVVDAYNGTTTFYRADPEDPIATALSQVFPDLLRPLDELPAELKRHLRYPEDIFGIQAEVFTTYHMTNPEVFYNKEDQWQIPAIEERGRPTPMEPYYTIMKLPGEEGEEFIQMLPFTPRLKANLASWMVARSDGEHYGHLMAFQFPKQKVIFGPGQVVARINQDQEISPQITLWNQQGSEVIQGTLLVIPIEESLLYVRPLYLRAQGGRIPELKRVIVAHQNQIVMEDSLDEALERLFGEAGGEASPERPRAGATPAETSAEPVRRASADLSALAGQAKDTWARALEAQRAGDWARYGEEVEALGALLERMARPDAPPE
jgi:hypothetical protein